MEATNEYQGVEGDAKDDIVIQPALHKLYHEDGKSYFSAQSVWTYERESQESDNLPKDIRLTFVDATNFMGYSATLDCMFLKEVKEQVLRKADKDFERWVRQAFQESSKDFSFTLTLQDQSTESADTSMQTNSHLVWKKVDGKFKIRLAQIPLTPVNFNKAHSKIFDTAIDQIQQSDIKIREMQEKQNRLMNDVQDYRNKMTEIRDCKAVLEEELFSAFLPILNSKQDEIRKLKRKIGELPGYKDDTSDDEPLTDDQKLSPVRRKMNKAASVGKGTLEKATERNYHTMSDSDGGSSDRNDSNTTELMCDTQNFLDISPS